MSTDGDPDAPSRGEGETASSASTGDTAPYPSEAGRDSTAPARDTSQPTGATPPPEPEQPAEQTAEARGPQPVTPPRPTLPEPPPVTRPAPGADSAAEPPPPGAPPPVRRTPPRPTVPEPPPAAGHRPAAPPRPTAPEPSADTEPAVSPAFNAEHAAMALAYPLAGAASAAVLAVIVMGVLDPDPGRHLRGLLVVLTLVTIITVACGWARTVWYGPITAKRQGEKHVK